MSLTKPIKLACAPTDNDIANMIKACLAIGLLTSRINILVITRLAPAIEPWLTVAFPLLEVWHSQGFLLLASLIIIIVTEAILFCQLLFYSYALFMFFYSFIL